MKLFLLTPSVRLVNLAGYYDGVVVCALNSVRAKEISPSPGYEWSLAYQAWTKNGQVVQHAFWVDNLAFLDVVCIGEAGAKVKPGVVLASFNVG